MTDPEFRDFSVIVEPLLAWFGTHARILPWRAGRTPYRVWISEIMLQQTQVHTVIPYYERFLAALPDIPALAAVPEETLLKLWEGLGYYSRAHNLRKAAQAIVREHGGRFPETFSAIRALPGIGDYTAGAIASICFDRPTPAVDGNVLRVIARLTADDGDTAAPAFKKHAAACLAAIYPPGRCGDFTESLMELGATVCLPNGQPRCGACPLAFCCRAHAQGRAESLPAKSAKKPRREEKLTVFLLRCEDRAAVRRRAPGGLLGGLWEFPHTAGHLSPEEAARLLTDRGLSPRSLCPGPAKRHIFTHIVWDMRSFSAVCEGTDDTLSWVTPDELAALALPSAFEPFRRAVLTSPGDDPASEPV